MAWLGEERPSNGMAESRKVLQWNHMAVQRKGVAQIRIAADRHRQEPQWKGKASHGIAMAQQGTEMQWFSNAVGCNGNARKCFDSNGIVKLGMVCNGTDGRRYEQQWSSEEGLWIARVLH